MVKDDLVFIIDDDLMLNEIHSMLFNKIYPDLLVKTFTTYAEALIAMENQELPGTIFLDLHIPQEHETTFLEEHRNRGFTSDIYLMSSTDFIDELGLISTYPAIVDFIRKPLLEDKIKPAFNHYA